jgi:hypothetical protein
MNYPINKTYVLGAMALGLAFVFVIGLTGATPAQACSGGCGTYYPPTYYPQPQPQPSPLQISCYPQPLTINAGDSSTWISNVYGGTGSYSYSWSGTDGLSGAGPSLSKVYYTAGPKSATLTVTSGNQTQSVSCSGSVNVYGNYNNPPYNPPPYYPPYNPPTYYPLQVSCTPNVTYTSAGNVVTWSASVYGGGYNSYNNNGYYYAPTYSWSGTDGLYGYGQSVSMTYTVPGYKTATVTVTMDGQTTSQICSNSVNVTGYAYNYNTYSYGYNYYNTNINSNNGLNIGCYADPSSASLNQPVTWSVEVTGGVGPYTYSWSGSDGLSGSSDSAIKYYNTYGEKNAVVSVTSADGKTGTRACSSNVTIRRPGGSYSAPTPAPTQTAPAQQGNNNQSAAALFSLQSIPWGWVAVLIILILFATIMYLIFNRPKI